MSMLVRTTLRKEIKAIGSVDHRKGSHLVKIIVCVYKGRQIPEIKINLEQG